MKEHQTIYDKMARERIDIATAQIDLLSCYDPERKEKRIQRLYDVSHRSLIDEPSEKSIEEMERVIKEFKAELAILREESPDAEASEKIRNKIEALEKLLASCSL